MRIWAWALLALLGNYAQAEVRFLIPGHCPDYFSTLSPHIPGLSDEYTVAVETPRMYLAFGPTQNRLEAFDKETGQYLGWVGMERLFGLGFLPIYFTDFKGSGLGTEAKYAAMRYAFEVEGVTGVIAMIAEDNIASQKLHLKLGFRELKRNEGVITYEASREGFEIAKQAFAAEDIQSFLPRGRAPLKLRQVTERVTKDPGLVESLFLNFLTQLESGIESVPVLNQSLYRIGENKERLLRTYSESLEPRRQALIQERDRALEEATTRVARVQIKAKYYNDLASLEGPLADALLHDFLTEPHFQKEIKESSAEPWVARLETIEAQGLSGTATGAIRLRARQLLMQLKQRGLLEKVTRLKAAEATP